MREIIQGQRQAVIESVIGDVSDDGRSAPVLLDPTPREITGLWNRLSGQDQYRLRGFLTDDHLIVWSGYHLPHHEMDGWLAAHAGIETGRNRCWQFDA